MRSSNRSWPMMVTAVAFLGGGAVVRFLPHPPNLTPLTAMALLAGVAWPMPVAALFAIGAMLVGDLALGWVSQNLMGYVSLALIVALGTRLRARLRPGRMMGSAVAGSSIFFLLSNFGVWVEGRLYPRTWDGLVACYVAGLPFYRNQLAGDLLYTALLVGGFAWLCRWRRWSTLQPAAARVPA